MPGPKDPSGVQYSSNHGLARPFTIVRTQLLPDDTRLMKPPVLRTAELTPSAPTMTSARSSSRPKSGPFSAVEVIITAPLGSALTAAHPNRVSTEARPATASSNSRCRSVRRTAIA